MTKEKIKPQITEKEKLNNLHQLIVYNDDVNTFDFVIETLMEVCKHEKEQAEQCTLIIHFKGKCDVKSGPYDYLKPMCEEILRRGIGASIDDI